MDKLQRKFNVRLNVVQGKNILVQRNNAFEIDEVGLHVWQLCDGNHTAEEIAEALTKEYQVEFAEALADVQQFINHLSSLELFQ